MKKAINILLIAILSIIFTGLVLCLVCFAKDTLFNNDTKAHSSNKNQVSNKKDSKDKKTKKRTDNSNENVQQDSNNNQSVESSTQTTTNNEKNSDDPYNLRRFDTDGDGLIEVSELTPEAQKLADEGKFQPVNDGEIERQQQYEKEMIEKGEEPYEGYFDEHPEDKPQDTGYNPNNPRGDVGSPGMSPAHDGIGNDDEE